MSQSETIVKLKHQTIVQQKQLEHLQNRINLLLKQQQETQQANLHANENKKLLQAYEKKFKHDSLKEELLNAKKQIVDKTPELQRKNYMMNYKINQAISEARQFIEDQRKIEAKKIKEINKQNDQMIKINKKNFEFKNQCQVKNIKQLEHLSKEKYQQYWNERTNNFLMEQEQKKYALSKSLNATENIFKELEKQELLLIQQLQKSKSSQQFLKNQIQDAQNLKIAEYEKKYGKPKQSKFKDIMDIKSSLN